MEINCIDAMADKWPSTICARGAIAEFTGGVYSSKYLANEDCARRGPNGKILIGGQVCYPVVALIEWLKSRSSDSWETRKKNTEL